MACPGGVWFGVDEVWEMRWWVLAIIIGIAIMVIKVWSKHAP